MKKRREYEAVKTVILILSILLIPITAFAHSGKTDGNGGHYDNDTGEYHYHHGYPAHSHEGGTCPYDFDTGEESGNYSSDKINKATHKHTTTTEYAAQKKELEESQQSHRIRNIFLLIGSIFISVLTIRKIIYIKREKGKKAEIEHASKIRLEYTTVLKGKISELRKREKQLNRISYLVLIQKHAQIAIRQHNLNRQTSTIINNYISSLSCRKSFIDDFYTNVKDTHPEVYYRYFYTDANLYQLAQVPSGIKIFDDGTIQDNFNLLKYYTAKKGKCYHFKAGCHGAYIEHNILNYQDTRYNYSMCTSCCVDSEKLPWMTDYPDWYHRFFEIKRIFNEYNIPYKSV